MCQSRPRRRALSRQVLAGFPSMQSDPLAHPGALARWRAEFFLKLNPHLFSWCHRAGALIVIPCSASRSHISRSVKSALSLIHPRNIGSTGARQDLRCPPICKLCRTPCSRRVLTWYTHTRLTSKRWAMAVGRSPCSIALSTLSRKSCEYACIAYSFRKKDAVSYHESFGFKSKCSNSFCWLSALPPVGTQRLVAPLDHDGFKHGLQLRHIMPAGARDYELQLLP